MEQEKQQYATPDIEKRKHRRAQLVTEIRCETSRHQELLVTRDISVGGVFVSAKKNFPRGSEVSLSLRLGPGGPGISCRAKVVYSVKGLGMGVEFLDLNDEARRAIQKFVDEAD